MNKKLIKTIASITCGLGVVATIPAMSTSCNCSSWIKNAIPKKYLDISDGVLKGFKNTFVADEHINDGYDTLLIPKDVVTIAAHAFDSDEESSIVIPTYIANIIFENNSKINNIESYAFNFAGFSPDKITFPEGLTQLGSMYNMSWGNSIITIPSSLNEIDQNYIFSGEYSWISTLIFNNVDLNKNHAWLQKINSVSFSDSLRTEGVIRVSGNSTSTSQEVLDYLKTHTAAESGLSSFDNWIAI